MAKNKGGRPSGEKTRCGGVWTEARFKTFVKGALRAATVKWAPIQQCIKDARVRRGWYLCAECKQEVPATIKTIIKSGKNAGKERRVKNAIVDHIKPVIDPEKGFTTWDECIENMFCEQDNLQCVCHACHQVKCQEEKEIAKARKEREKEGG